MRDANGTIGNTALVIEPVHASEIAPIITQAYSLSRKVGVSSRGELVAKLFAEHYAPIHLDPEGIDRVGE